MASPKAPLSNLVNSLPKKIYIYSIPMKALYHDHHEVTQKEDILLKQDTLRFRFTFSVSITIVFITNA